MTKKKSRGMTVWIPAPTESEIQARIVKALRSQHYKVLRIPASGMRGRTNQGAGAGTPDLCVLGPRGLTVWIEVKRPGKQLEVDQREWHEWAIDCEHRVIVCHSELDALVYMRKAYASVCEVRG
jgi:hypothetical protein